MWLDSTIDKSNDDCRNSITQLQCIVNTIDTFNDVDQCIDSLTEIKDEKTFMLVSSVFGQEIIPLIHDIPQLHSIYVYNDKQSSEELWMKKYSKVKGVFTQISSICELLKQAARHCDRNSIPISFLPPDYGTSNKSLASNSINLLCIQNCLKKFYSNLHILNSRLKI